MEDISKLREVVERVVAETLESHVSALKSEIVERASQELESFVSQQPATAASSPETSSDGSMPAGSAPTDQLNAAFCTVLDSGSQADILSSLLEGTGKFSKRSALFVMKGGN